MSNWGQQEGAGASETEGLGASVRLRVLGVTQVGSQHSPPDPGPSLGSDLSFFQLPEENS